MALKKFKPTTPSRRFMSLSDFDEVTKDNSPEKGLLRPGKKSGGRNNRGRITVRHRGGGHKRRYRLIDFKRNKHGVPAKVASIEYDPNRSARIALLHYADGEKRYILAPVGLQVGSTVISGPEAKAEVGNNLPLANIPLGTSLHNVEIRPGSGGKMARSAGQFAQLVSREGGYANIKLPSSEIRKVRTECYATVGRVGNTEHESVVSGKAGRKRWMGVRPTVRGVAMNPVDHPMGGGEGRSSGGGHPVSPWGQPAKGKKTRSRSNPSNKFIVERRRKK